MLTHLGIKSNEAADQVAKQVIDIIGMTQTGYCPAIWRAIKFEWSRKWETITNQLFNIKPHIEEC